MTWTMPYSYGSTRVTMEELETKTTWKNCHPEFQRRLKAMLTEGQGRIGVGTAWRSSDVQRSVFLQRHYVVSSGGCCSYEGSRYQLRSGMAHAAPPGKSFHESTFHGYAQACDIVGNYGWMFTVEKDYGLKDFRDVGNEPWHIQLSEISNSVTQWKNAGSPQPITWNLPDDAPAPVTAVFGPDVSSYEDDLVPPDPPGIAFAICRASIGVKPDDQVDVIAAWCKARMMPFAAFHYVYPTKTHPAVDQAKTFHDSVGDSRIVCMLDWEDDEDDNCHPGGGPQAATWTDVLNVAAEVRKLGHRCTLVYTASRYWSEQGEPSMDGCGLSLVNQLYGPQPWPTGTPIDVYRAVGGDTGMGWAGYGGLTPVIWQFTQQATWGNLRLDMNAYKGDVANLATWFTMWTEEEDDLTEEQMDELVKRVWAYNVTDIVTEKPTPISTLVRYARSDANKAYNNTANLAKKVWDHITTDIVTEANETMRNLVRFTRSQVAQIDKQVEP